MIKFKADENQLYTMFKNVFLASQGGYGPEDQCSDVFTPADFISLIRFCYNQKLIKELSAFDLSDKDNANKIDDLIEQIESSKVVTSIEADYVRGHRIKLTIFPLKDLDGWWRVDSKLDINYHSWSETYDNMPKLFKVSGISEYEIWGYNLP